MANRPEAKDCEGTNRTINVLSKRGLGPDFVGTPIVRNGIIDLYFCFLRNRNVLLLFHKLE